MRGRSKYIQMDAAGDAGAVPPAGGAATPPPANGATPPPAAGAASDWTAPLSAEQRGWIQAKGVSGPADLVEMWKGMEKIQGAPKEQLAILPKEIKGLDDVRPILARLGTPAEAKDYGLKGDSPDFVNQIQGIFHKAALTKEQATMVATEWTAAQTAIQGAAVAAYEAKVVAEKQALSTEWGTAHDQNIAIAKHAAAKFGLTPPMLAALEKMASTETTAGYNAVMKLFHQIGVGMGEAQFVKGAAAPGQITPDQAKAEKEMLMADQSWRQSYLNGDAAKNKKMQELIAAELGIQL
jgi:hypothetical protein